MLVSIVQCHNWGPTYVWWAHPYIRYFKKSKCRCPVSDVTIKVLRMYTEHNHILSPTLAYVCMLSATIYIRSYKGYRLANPYLGCATMYEVPHWNQNMVAQPYIIPRQGNISRQNNMSSHIELCDVLGLRRMSYVLTSVAAFIHWIPMYNPYPLLLPDYENTESRSPYRLVLFPYHEKFYLVNYTHNVFCKCVYHTW